MQKLTICVFVEFDPAAHSAEAIDRAVSEKIEAAIRDDMPPGSRLDAIHCPEWAQDEDDDIEIFQCGECGDTGSERYFYGDEHSIVLSCPVCFSDTITPLRDEPADDDTRANGPRR